VEEGMREAAEEALYDLGIHNVHPEIVKVLGRLKFRTSYGQNQLVHSKEVARLAGMMAEEMGVDAQAGPAGRPPPRRGEGDDPRP
jgi:ribonucrease Y